MMELLDFLVDLIEVLWNWKFWVPILVSVGVAALIYFYLPELILKEAYMAFVIGIGVVVGYRFNGRIGF